MREQQGATALGREETAHLEAEAAERGGMNDVGALGEDQLSGDDLSLEPPNGGEPELVLIIFSTGRRQWRDRRQWQQ